MAASSLPWDPSASGQLGTGQKGPGRPGVRVGKDLPCRTPCSFTGGQTGACCYPVTVRAPSKAPGLAHGRFSVRAPPPRLMGLLPGPGGALGRGVSHASAPPLNGVTLHFPFLFQTSAPCFVTRRNPLAKKGMKTTDPKMKNEFFPNQ